jgi:hypothetical protein
VLAFLSNSTRWHRFNNVIICPLRTLSALLRGSSGATLVRKSEQQECLAIPGSLFVFFLSANIAFADFSGPVISVLDGDTIEAARSPVKKLYTLSIWGFGLMWIILRAWNHFPPDKNCQLVFQLQLI